MFMLLVYFLLAKGDEVADHAHVAGTAPLEAAAEQLQVLAVGGERLAPGVACGQGVHHGEPNGRQRPAEAIEHMLALAARRRQAFALQQGHAARYQGLGTAR
jgi:hypothetical protein